MEAGGFSNVAGATNPVMRAVQAAASDRVVPEPSPHTGFQRLRPATGPGSESAAARGQQLLESGQFEFVRGSIVGGRDARNGQRGLHTFVDAGAGSITGILKSRAAGGAQEAFASDVARAMRIGVLPSEKGVSPTRPSSTAAESVAVHCAVGGRCTPSSVGKRNWRSAELPPETSATLAQS